MKDTSWVAWAVAGLALGITADLTTELARACSPAPPPKEILRLELRDAEAAPEGVAASIEVWLGSYGEPKKLVVSP